MSFLLRVRKTGQELSRYIKKNKKRGKPKTGHCEGAMNNSDMDTRNNITPARCYLPTTIMIKKKMWELAQKW